MVPLDTPILVPASACVRSSRSQSLKVSSSSRKRGTCSISDIGTHVGLNALPLNLHLQFRGFLHLGDMPTPFIVHMHRTLAGTPDFVKYYSFSRCFFKLLPLKYNIVLFRQCDTVKRAERRGRGSGEKIVRLLRKTGKHCYRADVMSCRFLCLLSRGQNFFKAFPVQRSPPFFDRT
jgi:hypothetical protein